MQARDRNILIGVLVVLAVVLLCAAALAGYQVFRRMGGIEPEPDLNVAYTQAAQTIVAQLTQQAGATAIAQLTAIAQGGQIPASPVVLPTDTSAPTQILPTQARPTFVVPATATPWWENPTPTNIVLPPTATRPPVVPCNVATFVRDISIPDNTLLPPNSRFTKIWRVRNDGTCFWDSSYALVFVSGRRMADSTTVLIPATVAPGQSIDLAIEMTSPGNAGTYQSNWMFRDPRGFMFGVGRNGEDPVYARIQVQAQPDPNPRYAYDFAANYCSAQWRSDDGVIGCTTPSGDSRGSVVYTTSPALEPRTENEPGLWVRPNQSANGYISGQFPAYVVKPGDRFVAEFSCQSSWSKCDVTFRVDYLLSNGSAGNLGAWREVYDNQSNTVSIDLTSLAGQSVQFTLRMQNNGNVSHANGIWFLPSIRNVPPTQTALPPTVTPTVTPTITPTPGDGSSSGTPYP